MTNLSNMLLYGFVDRRSFYMWDVDVGAYDVLRNKFGSFKPELNVSIMTVTRLTHARPDLIAMDAYSNTDYWWIIMMFNGIDDIYNDLYDGRDLLIPDKRDVEAFWNNTFSGKARLK